MSRRKKNGCREERMTKMVAYWVVTVLIALETLVGGVTDLIHGRSEQAAIKQKIDSEMRKVRLIIMRNFCATARICVIQAGIRPVRTFSLGVKFRL
jgi:hypothetical protein